MHIYWSRWRHAISVSTGVIFGLLFMAAISFSFPTHVAAQTPDEEELCKSIGLKAPCIDPNRNKASMTDPNSIKQGSVTFTKTNIPCGSTKNEEAERDIRNFAGDQNCSGNVTYYKNDAGGSSCDSYIIIKGDVTKAKTAQYLRRTLDLTADCSVSERRDLVINDGKTFTEQKRLDEKNSRRDTFSKNLGLTCSRVDPDNVVKCQDKLLKAFDECYNQLSGNFSKDVAEDRLLQCVADKTGYPLGLLQGSLAKGASNDEFKKCDVNGLGWIICQLSRVIGKMVDGMYKFLSLVMELPSMDSQKDGGREVYSAWRSINAVANVVFIIGFLALIYSQITGGGFSNYAIKRMLPRLIVAAILVNVSFYICAIAIDISNILGRSLKDVLTNLAPTVAPGLGSFEQVAGLGLVAVGGILVYMQVFSFFPILVAGIIALIITIFILLARQALVIVLVLLSPLAFVANMLPNTQKWFGRWWSTFFVLLLLYPAVGVIYGGSRIAAGVISRAAPSDANTSLLFAGFALGVQIIPFFLTPIILRLSGSLLNRFTGIVNNPDKGPFDAAKKRSRRWADNKDSQRELASLTGGNNAALRTYHRFKARRSVSQNYQKGRGLNLAKAQFLSQGDVAAEVANEATKGFKDTSQREERINALNDLANNTRIQLDIEDIDAADAEIDELLLKNAPLNLTDRAKDGKDEQGNAISQEEQAAAMRRLASEGDLDQIHDLIEASGSMDKNLRKALADGIAQSKISGKALHLGGSGLQSIRDGTSGGVSGLYNRAADAGKYTPQALAGQSAKAVQGMQTHMGSSGRAAVKDSYRRLQDDPQIRQKLSSGANRVLANMN